MKYTQDMTIALDGKKRRVMQEKMMKRHRKGAEPLDLTAIKTPPRVVLSRAARSLSQ